MLLFPFHQSPFLQLLLTSQQFQHYTKIGLVAGKYILSFVLSSTITARFSSNLWRP